ncbi:glutamine synthetase family protein [Leisingera methylohalidivorans]|uniref:Glutamine synthetase n=1 Tax=Leisingera methylohalidivorans DSM 14336 TaxID=999552 RepID=V9VSE0_9RHOB|nr:glutamine synthetase family protein [Leisingera methylohalidivorans]AHD01671.1 glutamine synthetase [Leisingera methylohalidivorans DSM 14336]
MAHEFTSGKLARLGLLSAEDCRQAAEITSRAQFDGIETVRVLFPDQHGLLRGKTVMAGAFASIFDRGLNVPATLLLKDTSHRNAFPVWEGSTGLAGPMRGAGDVLLVPRPDTFRALPWSGHSAWIFCTPVYPDGSPVPFASCSVLQRAVEALEGQGMAASFGLEAEFHICELAGRSAAGDAAARPGAPEQPRNLTRGYQYLAETCYGEVEGVLDLLRRNAQKLGLPVRSVEIEMGPGQVEFTFAPGGAMAQADAMVMFRTMVKEVCARNGLHASFMAKPRLAGAMANGWHVHQSLQDQASGRQLFMPEAAGELSPQASAWMAGLLKYATETSLLIAPTVNSYKRYLPFQLAPNRIGWGEDNRGAMLRALMQPGDTASRIENRAPDSSANPYYALAAQIIAGLAGITEGLEAPPPTLSPYGEDSDRLPRSLGRALDGFGGSLMCRAALGEAFTSYLLQLKQFEWDRYLDTVSEWEQAEYFNLL